MKKSLLIILTLLLSFSVFSQENRITVDFKNQEITDIIYSIADMCEVSVFIDETVTGRTTFHFEDKDFSSAMQRFCEYCQLYMEKKSNIYYFSKIYIKENKQKFDVQAENVNVEQLLIHLSREAKTTILYDMLPNMNVTVRTTNSTLPDILNLIVIKLNGFSVERVGSGYYLCKSSTSTARRNFDSYKLFELDSEKGIYGLDLQSASSLNVIDDLFKKAGKEYSLINVKSVNLEKLYFDNKSFDDLLKLILEQSSCDFSIDNGIYYIFEVRKQDLVKSHKKVEIIKVQHYSVENIVSLIPNEYNAGSFIKADKATNTIYITGSNEEITPIINFINQIDVPLEDRYYQKFTLVNVNVKDVVSIIPKNLLFSEITIVPNSNSFVTQVNKERENELNEYLKILDQKMESYPVNLKYIKSSELLQYLPPSVNKEAVIVTQNDSLIFLNTTKEVYNQFIKELELIDKPKKQIKYQMLVVQQQKSDSFNISGSVGATTETIDNPKHSVSLSEVMNIHFDIISEFGLNFAINFNAQLAENKSHILADTTLNGISGQTVTFANTNTFRFYNADISDANTTTTTIYKTTVKEITTGLNISINGWVSGDGMVTVDVNAQISKRGQATSEKDIPSTSEKKITTNVRTKSGSPVIISGLLQQEDDTESSETPGLAKIPLLGYLFKKEKNSSVETELVIYLIPFVEETEAENELSIMRIKRMYEQYVLEAE
jgi:type II secretory pathway component GspD/PulD (secretin)